MSELIMYEGPNSITLAGFATLPADEREVAWAEQYVNHDPDLKWILGNFVQSDVPNDNGHIFPLEDLKQTHSTLVNKPMNMLHNAGHIVGHYAGTQLMYPEKAEASTKVQTPYIEVVGAFYEYYFPEEYEKVAKAFKDG